MFPLTYQNKRTNYVCMQTEGLMHNILVSSFVHSQNCKPNVPFSILTNRIDSNFIYIQFGFKQPWQMIWWICEMFLYKLLQPSAWGQQTKCQLYLEKISSHWQWVGYFVCVCRWNQLTTEFIPSNIRLAENKHVLNWNNCLIATHKNRPSKQL